MTHTPGPWKASVVHGEANSLWNVCAEDGSLTAQFSTRGWCNAKANAHLIAAAPEMLTLLKSVARSACLDQRVGGRCICFACEAEAMVRKAEGREP